MATTKIKCPVEGIIELDRLPGVTPEKVRAVVDSPELQRLRWVKQLGFTDRVYPGATHTRFSHSLGAFQGAQRTMTQMRRAGADIPPEWYAATTMACLLHDLGHGPFSHTFESVTGQSHEARTREILTRGPQLPDRLENLGPGAAERVRQLVAGKVEIPELRYLADLVSSALDCDRMDYLRRDALYTGASYGSFDRDWIVREMVPTRDGSAVVVVEKGRSAVEQYLIGRYHMFQNVYLHKTSRGFETAFRGLCRRLQALGAAAVPAPGRALRALYDKPLSLETFLTLRDIDFEVEITALVHHEDATVRVLTRALMERRPLRSATTRGEASALDSLHDQRREAAAKAGLDPDTAVWRDAAKDHPYQPYSPKAGRKGLRMQTTGGDLVDVTELSATIAALSGPAVVHRLYWVDPDPA
jgi:HD superfamily phosphohydrolase